MQQIRIDLFDGESVWAFVLKEHASDSFYELYTHPAAAARLAAACGCSVSALRVTDGKDGALAVTVRYDELDGARAETSSPVMLPATVVMAESASLKIMAPATPIAVIEALAANHLSVAAAGKLLELPLRAMFKDDRGSEAWIDIATRSSVLGVLQHGEPSRALLRFHPNGKPRSIVIAPHDGGPFGIFPMLTTRYMPLGNCAYCVGAWSDYYFETSYSQYENLEVLAIYDVLQPK